jgi:hypothetical protein
MFMGVGKWDGVNCKEVNVFELDPNRLHQKQAKLDNQAPGMPFNEWRSIPTFAKAVELGRPRSSRRSCLPQGRAQPLTRT